MCIGHLINNVHIIKENATSLGITHLANENMVKYIVYLIKYIHYHYNS
jgi:hypothetical protein